MLVERIGAGHLRYRVNGKQVSVKLADYSDEYRTLTSVRPLAEPYLQTANSGQQANGHLNLQQYAETVYFPHAKKSLKPSTYKGYFNLVWSKNSSGPPPHARTSLQA